MAMTFTFVRKRATPVVQTVIAFLIGISGMLICKSLGIEGASEYFCAYIALIFYCLINIVVSLAYENFLRYTMPSLYLYILLAVSLLLSAKLFSGISIWTLYEYRMMIIPISVFYFMASIFVRGIRFIYEAAEKGEL